MEMQPQRTDLWTRVGRGKKGWHEWRVQHGSICNSVQFIAWSCPTLCNPMNSSMLGLPVHHQLLESTQTRVHSVGDAIRPSHPLSDSQWKFAVWLRELKPGLCNNLLLLLLSHSSRVRLCATPQTAAHQAPLFLGFSRQEHWSGLPFPSPMHESEKWKWSRSVVSDS